MTMGILEADWLREVELYDVKILLVRAGRFAGGSCELRAGLR